MIQPREEPNLKPATPLLHPILAAGLSLVVIRIAALAIQPLAVGSTALAAEAGSLPGALFLHVGETCIVVAAMLVGTLAPLPLRRVWIALCLAVLAFLGFLSLSDPILRSIIGERLIPSTLRHFGGFDLFVSDSFWMPVRAYWKPIAAGLAVLLLYGGWLARLAVGRTHARVHASLPASLAAAGSVLVLAAPLLSERGLAEPVEIAYARELAGLDRTLPEGPEDRAIERLRQFVGLPGGARWADDRFSLVHAYDPGGVHPGPEGFPDIILLQIESLRGANLEFINPEGPWHVATPNLSRLAARSVVFRRHIANGFPTGPGFITANASIWPHRRKRLSTEFAGKSFDSIPRRLGTLGYATAHVELDAGFDRREEWVDGRVDRLIDAGAGDLPNTEESLIDQTLAWIDDHDRARPDRPLFVELMTGHPHMPYEWPDADGNFHFGPDLAENYRTSLAYVDGQLGRLFDALKARPRWARTLLVVTGDHANFLDQRHTTGAPVDDVAWTGLLIAGGLPQIGGPRVDLRHSSHVDILPTILAAVGDRRPSATLGRDLLAPEDGRRARAVAVRGGGLRLDEGGRSLILSGPDARIRHEGPASPAYGGKRAPVLDPARDEALRDAVRTWTFLLETDRVWSPEFLAGGSPAIPRSDEEVPDA